MSNALDGRSSLPRLLRAALNSWSGLRQAYREEAAFRQETWLAVVMIPAAFWLGESWAEVALLAGVVVLVLIVELLNSAVEAAIDRISADWHALSKRAKDIGSAAVLLSLLLCAAVWVAALAKRSVQA
jgi:diacylglycerol kinase (ATP)